MLEIVRERRPGVTLEAKGVDVLLSVEGISLWEGQAEVLISTGEARKLALRLLQMAEQQERQLANFVKLKEALDTLRRAAQGDR